MGTRHGAAALSANDAGDWVQAPAALSRLARERAALDADEGRWLLCAWRSAAHVHLGYGSFAQYVEQLFGDKPRTTQEKAEGRRFLERLPRVARELEAGALSWSAARELARVAAPETEQAWLDMARGKTLRELELLVASKAPGDAPDAPALETPRSRVLRFEVAADTFATFREAMLGLQRLAGGSLDDDAVLLAMARHGLGGPRDDGRSSYQVSLSVCGACGGGAQRAGGELVPVDAGVVAMAACDAQHFGEVRAANENARVGAEPSGGESTRARQSSDNAHVGVRTTRAEAHTSRRAKQSIPPGAASRRAHARSTPLPRAGLHASCPAALRRRSS